MKKLTDLMSKTGKWLLVFGILFSQLSFPLSVLAEEVMNTKSTTEDEQLIDLDKNLENSNENLDENENLENETPNQINEENQIDGSDENQTDGSSENQTDGSDENQSDGSGEILEELEPAENGSIQVELKDDLCIIKSTLTIPVTVERLSKEVENFLKVTTEDDSQIELNENVYTSYKLILTTDLGETSYNIILLGDYDANGIVDDDDQQAMLKSLLQDEDMQDVMSIVDVNEDGEFNILDVTHPIFTDNSWVESVSANDELSTYLSLDGTQTEFYVGEEIKFNYYIENFKEDTLKGIEGNLVYDTELLELTAIQVNQIEQDITSIENGKFAYLLDDYQSNDALIVFTFVAKSVGTPDVSIDNIIASVGGVSAKLDSVNVITSTSIVEYGKGGDVEEVLPSSDSTTSATVATVQTEDSTIVPTTTSKVIEYLSLSTDNYIKSLSIEGYEIDFDMYTYEYAITVKNSVNSLDLNVVLNDDNASFYVEGNSDFKVGENTVNIVVKSESGSTRTYTIKVNKEKAKSSTTKDSSEEEETSSSSKTVIIILIVLVIIGLIYVIFKDDEDDKKESKK